MADTDTIASFIAWPIPILKKKADSIGADTDTDTIGTSLYNISIKSSTYYHIWIKSYLKIKLNLN